MRVRLPGALSSIWRYRTMSTHFRPKNGKPVAAAKVPSLPADFFREAPEGPKLPGRLWSWLDRRLKAEGASLSRRRPGIDVLEPRLLMSGDPATAVAAMAAGVENATLRITQVDTGNNTSEDRLQLIQGTNAANTSATVLSEWKVEMQGDTKRIVQVGKTGAANAIDVLSISGNSADNILVLDQSVLGLAEGLEVRISLGAGNDTIRGPEASTGLVWTLDAVDGNGADGSISLLQPAADSNDPDTETAEADKPLDTRVTHAGGRDHFLTFNDVEGFDMRATRDIVADRTAGASEWGLTWDAGGIALKRFTDAQGVSAGTPAAGRTSSLSVTGAEGLTTTGAGHLNLGYQSVTANQTGATINAGSGQISLYQPGDSDRQNPLFFDVRGMSGYTGTMGRDVARAAAGVGMNLLGGEDSLTGSDDQLVWTLTDRSATGNAEAAFTLGFHQLDAEGDWVSLNRDATYYGIDRVTGGDNADRLVLDYGQAVTVVVSGSIEAPRVSVSTTGGAGTALIADGFEQIVASVSPSATALNLIDYSALSDDISFDQTEGSASGFTSVAGFTAIRTGAGDDSVVVDAGMRSVITGAGDDVVTLGATLGALSVDLGAGSDTLQGDQDETGLLAGVETPLGTRFTVTSLGADGAAGRAQLRFGAGDAFTAGQDISFTGAESLARLGGEDDPDSLIFDLNVATGSTATWYIPDVYAGAILLGGARLSYEGIRLAGMESSGGRTNPLVRLSYAGDGAGIAQYESAVSVDLTQGLVSGLAGWTGAVDALIGTEFDDSLMGDATTRLVQGGAGDDRIGTRLIAGATLDGGAGADMVFYDRAAATTVLTDTAITQGGSVVGLSGIESAFLAADADTAGTTIDASGFTRGSVTLRGGAGDDILIGSAQNDVFTESGGSDQMTGNAGVNSFAASGLAGNRALADGAEDGTIVYTHPDGAHTLTGVSLFSLGGDDGANVFDASGLTRARVALYGGAGDDTLKGGALDDTLSGGMGQDVFDGGAGANTLLEDGFTQYHVGASGLLHDSEEDGASTITVTLPVSAGTGDSFRLTLTLADGSTLSTASIGFTATADQVAAQIYALRQFDESAVDVLVTTANGRVTSVQLVLRDSFAGRDPGFALSASGSSRATANAAAVAFAATGVLVVGTRKLTTPETLTNIQTLDLRLDLERAGWADIAGWAGAAVLTGSELDDVVRLGAKHRAMLGAGSDRVTLTAAGSYDAALMIDGGAGSDWLLVTGQTVLVSDGSVSFGSDAQRVATAGFENYILTGTSGNDTLSAAGLTSGQLSPTTLLSLLARGAGLPMRDGVDFTVTHPDGTTVQIDIPSTATTLQHVLDAFARDAAGNASGLTATLSGGVITVSSSRSGSSALSFAGVAVTGNGAGGEVATWVDSEVLEVLGLDRAKITGAVAKAAPASAGGVLIQSLGGADVITGSAGDDVILIEGSATIAGGGGSDRVILSAAGLAGDFKLETVTEAGDTFDRVSPVVEGAAGAALATISGVELIELRGASGANSIDASALQTDFLYRTGGGADTVKLGSGASTVVVNDAGTGATTISGSHGATVWLEASGEISQATFARIAALPSGAQLLVGAAPALAEAMHRTGVD
ncbi:hypothetical protein C5F48_19550, partial [Cereibacter changlensis JA139]